MVVPESHMLLLSIITSHICEPTRGRSSCHLQVLTPLRSNSCMHALFNANPQAPTQRPRWCPRTACCWMAHVLTPYEWKQTEGEACIDCRSKLRGQGGARGLLAAGRHMHCRGGSTHRRVYTDLEGASLRAGPQREAEH
eukprot:225994-Pelagomonas_calceolata.AAC.1